MISAVSNLGLQVCSTVVSTLVSLTVRGLWWGTKRIIWGSNRTLSVEEKILLQQQDILKRLEENQHISEQQQQIITALTTQAEVVHSIEKTVESKFLSIKD